MSNCAVQALKDRRSIRSYDSGRQVPEELLQEILQVAINSPTARNKQKYHFTVVQQTELLEHMDDLIRQVMLNGSEEHRAKASKPGYSPLHHAPTVIVITGDGDSSAIGGNHLIHAARRNIDLTVVVFNNNIYGMTGGQFSPTTPTGSLATTAPYGSIDRTFDLPTLAMGAGATYAARGSAFHVPQTTKLIQDGIAHKGFALIDCMAVCPTYYGRKNK